MCRMRENVQGATVSEGSGGGFGETKPGAVGFKFGYNLIELGEESLVAKPNIEEKAVYGPCLRGIGEFVVEPPSLDVLVNQIGRTPEFGVKIRNKLEEGKRKLEEMLRRDGYGDDEKFMERSKNLMELLSRDALNLTLNRKVVEKRRKPEIDDDNVLDNPEIVAKEFKADRRKKKKPI